MRGGAACTALIEKRDAVERRIEEAPLARAGARSGAAMQQHDGHTMTIARLLPVQRVARVDPEHAGIERLDLRVQLGAQRASDVVHLVKRAIKTRLAVPHLP